MHIRPRVLCMWTPQLWLSECECRSHSSRIAFERTLLDFTDTLDRGAHLMTIVPQVWTAEVGGGRVKEVVNEGFELLKMGWEKDDSILKHSIVGPLMR